jgi:thioredoxin-related protein
MKRLYKPLILIGAFFSLAASGQPPRAPTEVPQAENLYRDAALASRRNLPIMLVFTGLVCSYCEELEALFIRPMLLSGDYTDKIIIRKLVVDNGSRVTDFSNQRVKTSDLAHEYGVYITPTILFVDADGRQLAERMVGINTVELYGGYLDQCIDTALLRLREPHRAEHAPGCRLELRRPGNSSPARFNPATL